MAKFIRRKAARPAKPRPDFPLFPHASGRWAKKVRQRFVYFGKVADDPKGEAALELWLDQKDDLLAGRTPRSKRDGLTVAELANHFLTSKTRLMATGDITGRTFDDYFASCQRVVAAFSKSRLVDDLAADDFERYRAKIGKTWGPVAIGNEVQRVRTLFKYGYDAGLIEKPVRFGPAFKKPPRKAMRLARAARGPRLFEADKLQKIIKAAGVPLQAMLLLGINCGLGNSDCGQLQHRHLDLVGGWLNYPRPKTGIARRCPLWPETVKALRTAMAKRPEPKDPAHASLIFITKHGAPWTKTGPDSPITKETSKLLKSLKMNRTGLSFYRLRHTLETIGSESRDQPALDHVMGHAREDMASIYRQRIDDDRLRAVVAHVRKWLFPPKKSKPRRKAK